MVRLGVSVPPAGFGRVGKSMSMIILSFFQRVLTLVLPPSSPSLSTRRPSVNTMFDCPAALVMVTSGSLCAMVSFSEFCEKRCIIASRPPPMPAMPLPPPPPATS